MVDRVRLYKQINSTDKEFTNICTLFLQYVSDLVSLPVIQRKPRIKKSMLYIINILYYY